MRCQDAQESIMLAQYGELPDLQALPLEQHLSACESCRREWTAQLALSEVLAHHPVEEPSPNLLALSRMRLDEALDAMPPRSFRQRLTGNAFRWLGFVTGSPALAVLLLGIGFLGGNGWRQYRELRAAQPGTAAAVTINHPDQGEIASVSGIRQTPNSDLVQVDYNRVVPETVQGSLSDPRIRNLVVLGTRLANTREAHDAAVSFVADECRNGSACSPGDGQDERASELRQALVSSLRTDKSPVIRLRDLDALQPYVSEDVKVRDAVLDTLLHDRSESVRTKAISMLSPVGADSSVRQALRAVSTEDGNPAVRNASFQVLQSAGDVQ